MKIIIKLCFFTVLIMIIPIISLAQSYQNSMPCSFKKNIELKKMIKAGTINGLMEHNVNNSSFEAWSTSILKPEGKPPIIESADKDELGETKIKYDNWSCMYSAYNAMDNNPKTAWSEGVEGDGIGEILIVSVDTSRPVEIWGGLGVSQELFNANNRPKNIRVYVLQANASSGAAQFGSFYSDIKVLGNHTIKLKDINNYQPLALPRFTLRKDGGRTFVAIEILSVYRGLKYKDTCISEIRNIESK